MHVLLLSTFYIVLTQVTFIILTFAAMQCEEGMVYKACGAICEDKCYKSKVDQFKKCNTTCVEGCHCPEGMVLQDGE